MNTFEKMTTNARVLEDLAIEIDEMILDVASLRGSAVIAGKAAADTYGDETEQIAKSLGDAIAAAFVLLAPLFEAALFELNARSSAALGQWMRESDRAMAAYNKSAAEREEALTIALAGARMLAKVRNRKLFADPE